MSVRLITDKLNELIFGCQLKQINSSATHNNIVMLVWTETKTWKKKLTGNL